MYTINFLNIRTSKKFVVITKILTMWLYHRIMSQNNTDRMENSVDPDHCTVCPDLSVRKLRVYCFYCAVTGLSDVLFL